MIHPNIGKTYKRILVVAPFRDLAWREETEGAFSAYLAKYKIDAVPSIGYLMPTRTYTDEEVMEVLWKNNFDGFLLIILTDAYSKQSYAPEQSYTSGEATLTGNTYSYAASTTSGSGASTAF